MEFIKADASHIRAVADLAHQLWEHHNLDDLLLDFTHIINSKDNAVFICCDNNENIGFAQFSLRHDDVEGTDARPIGYVEGIYVREQYRNMGIARNLINKGEAWASEKGCSQMASDCELVNTSSLAFHLNCGFTEANRIICFVKDIGKHEGNVL